MLASTGGRRTVFSPRRTDPGYSRMNGLVCFDVMPATGVVRWYEAPAAGTAAGVGWQFFGSERVQSQATVIDVTLLCDLSEISVSTGLVWQSVDLQYTSAPLLIVYTSWLHHILHTLAADQSWRSREVWADVTDEAREQSGGDHVEVESAAKVDGLRSAKTTAVRQHPTAPLAPGCTPTPGLATGTATSDVGHEPSNGAGDARLGVHLGVDPPG